MANYDSDLQTSNRIVGNPKDSGSGQKLSRLPYTYKIARAATQCHDSFTAGSIDSVLLQRI